jgi:hypothetical protein
LAWALAEHQGHDAAALDGRLAESRARFAEIGQRERDVGRQVAAAKLPPAQVVNVLEPLRQMREELGIELQRLEQTKAEMMVARPVSEIASAIRQIDSEDLLGRTLYRDLARRVFRRIDVFAEKVRLTFTDGSGLELPRIQIGNSRTLPLPVTLLGSELRVGGHGGPPRTTKEHHAVIVYLRRDSQARENRTAWRPTPPDKNEVLYDNGKLLVELSP